MKTRPVAAVPAWRIRVVAVGLGCLALVLVARLISLQLLDTERGYRFLQKQGNARSLRVEPIPTHRGIISDRNGEPLAISTPVQTLWANPRQLVAGMQAGDWARLEGALEVPAGELEQRMRALANREFAYLRRRMTPADAQRVLDLGIVGVYARREYQRFYPAGQIAAHVIGFTNVDDHGQEGIELAYDEWLAGVEGSKQVIKDLFGHVIRDVQELSPARPGRALELGLDLRMQYLAHRELTKAVEAAGAEAGCVVLIDARSGEVLAMANVPSYNPNNRGADIGQALRNRAITDQFEPGSTMKPLTMIAALESGKYHPGMTIDTSPGYIRVGRKTFRDHNNYGLLSLGGVITKSSQVGTTKIALSLDPNAIRDVFVRAGLGQSLGTGFPGESIGRLPAPRKWSDVARANFAFGYGLSVTPLQLARAYSVIAAGGVERPITLLRARETRQEKQVYERESVAELITMMRTVTQPGGTAVRAAIKGYTVAGKTGTVHRLGSHGYEADRYVSLFAGFAPASDPRVVGVVIVSDPRGGVYYGGAIAAPVFSSVVAGALRLMNVAPDDLEQILPPAQALARKPA
ncbi:MAG: penicillin-binding protein 2 [Pseudomonadales bacterium]|jgi:cell division protein FtsI (penicillin-binding protein 3)|nr:penicillin-binding protein 2 [Pseudomonadales bacterium]MCP5321528.1 penicillin-binding protein 2 [Pseudomonadales bacterium]MCP5336441.1 penicillin-binding protein 2 [Pseudomonadales bacterium]